MPMEGLDYSVTRCLKKRQQRRSWKKYLKEKRFKLEEERAAATSVILEKEKCDKTAATDEKMY